MWLIGCYQGAPKAREAKRANGCYNDNCNIVIEMTMNIML